ncbi:MAG: GNAT family N-acetyltransferase [Balneolaceae bacterium]|nr:GNAT family N-acetyltransferase [Balneolaceae bacterium]MBO6546167.1 GNAT family N-acetyltransferase [Balneolaceae bacterium]MBO6648525.1 GNAT family N-acetyltransferase [Balneolaceae bacterium]
MSTTNPVTTSTNVNSLSIPGHKYSVRIAQTREKIEEALRLRFDVFNIELGEGLDSSFKNKMDEDEYDAQCHHLIVVENASDRVIGTYRMQDNAMADSGNGFYTQSEFDVSKFPDQVVENVVELGRACIHLDHRSGRVLYLLWRGLAKYLMLSQKRYLFGCCSITSQNPAEGEAVYQYLQDQDYLSTDYSIPVQDAFECLKFAKNYNYDEEVKLPQLFRLYMDIGVKVCSKPALDSTFKTIDYLILLDIETLSEQSKTLFFK